MITITALQLIGFVQTINGQTLYTAKQRKAFQVRTADDGIEYIPASTGLVRTHPHRWLDRFCIEFSRTNSFITSDYQKITVNASYALAIVREYLNQTSKRQTGT